MCRWEPLPMGTLFMHTMLTQSKCSISLGAQGRQHMNPVSSLNSPSLPGCQRPGFLIGSSCHRGFASGARYAPQEQRHVSIPVVSQRRSGSSSRDSYSEDEEDSAVRGVRLASRVTIPATIASQPIHTSPSASSTLSLPPQPSHSHSNTPPSNSLSTASTSTYDSAIEESDTDGNIAAQAARMFNSTHVTWTPLLAAYAPFGVLLAAVRMTCWVLGVLLDLPVFRNQSVISSYLKLLGFTVNWRNLHLLPQGHHVMVSNHTTSADLMVLFQLPQRYQHLITTAMPARVLATNNLPVKLLPATPDMYEQLARQLADPSSCSSPPPPVHVFPEGGLTNGSSCMQFSRGFMKFVKPGTPVVPVALRAKPAWGIRTHTLNSSFLANLFWLSFVPWVEVEAVVLPPTTQEEGEGRGAFVQRVQNQIAGQLGVPVSSITIQQKRHMMKAAATKKLR